MKNLYLVAALIGTVIPYYFFLQHFGAEGYSVIAFLKALFSNPAAAGGHADLFISSFVFWIYMFRERPGGPAPWPFILLNLSIGLSCALPMYLYWRLRQTGEVQGPV